MTLERLDIRMKMGKGGRREEEGEENLLILRTFLPLSGREKGGGGGGGEGVTIARVHLKLSSITSFLQEEKERKEGGRSIKERRLTDVTSILPIGGSCRERAGGGEKERRRKVVRMNAVE